MFFRKWYRIKILELAYMSVLTDAVNRNTASADALAAAFAAAPKPVDESAAAAQINANSDKVDAVTAAIPKP